MTSDVVQVALKSEFLWASYFTLTKEDYAFAACVDPSVSFSFGITVEETIGPIKVKNKPTGFDQMPFSEVQGGVCSCGNGRVCSSSSQTQALV